MIKVFQVSEETDSKIIGRPYPQVVGSDDRSLLDENLKRDENDKFKNLPNDGFSAKISKGVKLTDTLSSFMTNHSPIVSEKFVDFLRNFTIPSFKLIPIRIYRDKELVVEKSYFIIHFLGNDILNIDFKNSTFEYLSGGAYLDRSLLNFTDYDDYLNKIKIDDRITLAKIKKPVMKGSLQNDLFFLGRFDAATYFITENLREEMGRQNITGFHLEEVGYVGR